MDFDTDLDQAFEIVRTVGQEIAEDPEWAHLVRAAPRPHRVNAFTPNGIDIRIVGETAPDWQWAIMGQIRLRLKKAFDAAGIELAYPRTKVFVTKHSRPASTTDKPRVETAMAKWLPAHPAGPTATDGISNNLAYPRTKVFVTNTPDRQAPPTNQE